MKKDQKPTWAKTGVILDKGYENIRMEIEDNVATIFIERPESMNALNTDTLEELCDAGEKAEAKGSRCLILTGAGDKAFVSGGDIKEMVNESPKKALERSKLSQKVGRMLEKASIPSIAAINGYALGGGCELTLACDLRIASENAVFGQPETGLGIIPGSGGTQRLPRKVGQPIAMDMILTGERISAKRALKLGLVNEVVSQDELMDRVREKAQKIAEKSKIPIQTAKNLIRVSEETGLRAGLELERKAFANLFDTEDQEEGMQAFLKKESRNFKMSRAGRKSLVIGCKTTIIS